MREMSLLEAVEKLLEHGSETVGLPDSECNFCCGTPKDHDDDCEWLAVEKAAERERAQPVTVQQWKALCEVQQGIIESQARQDRLAEKYGIDVGYIQKLEAVRDAAQYVVKSGEIYNRHGVFVCVYHPWFTLLKEMLDKAEEK